MEQVQSHTYMTHGFRMTKYSRISSYIRDFLTYEENFHNFFNSVELSSSN